MKMPKKFMDTHMHHGINTRFFMSNHMVIEMLDRYHINSALVSNCRGGEVDSNQNILPKKYQISQYQVLKESIAFARKNPGRFYIAPWIKPLTEKCDERYQKLIEKNLDIIKAIKIHPFSSKVSPDDIRLEPYYTMCSRFHLAVVSHTDGEKQSAPVHLYHAAKNHPDINFVMVHLGLGTDHKEAISFLKKAPNLYADTTWVDMETTIKVIKEIGSTRIMFGSDGPIDGVSTYEYNKGGETSIYLDYFTKLPKLINKKDYENLMYKTAEKVFNIKI